MNILFLSISSLPHLSEHSISLDLIREFKKNGHNIFVVCALEKREDKITYINEECGCKVLRVRIGNNKKAGLFEKGLTTIFLPKYYKKAIRQNWSKEKFDLVIYPTPPVTQVETVKFIKKKYGAKSYLLLKDIFPQNAVDLGMMSKKGLKSIIYKYFRRKEKALYRVSDYIGCMSKANVNYLIQHNNEIARNKVEVCPNSISIETNNVINNDRIDIRKKYGIPIDKKIFVYGGNLGKPQGIPFLIECLKSQKNNDNVFFLIVGSGTEYEKLVDFMENEKQKNVKIMSSLPKNEYDKMVACCDVGMIFLDYRFTIPNFPSRLLAYMQVKIPVLAVTDSNTDIGKVVVEGGFGWKCESDNVQEFSNLINVIENENLSTMGENGYRYLQRNYSVEKAYSIIIKHFE